MLRIVAQSLVLLVSTISLLAQAGQWSTTSHVGYAVNRQSSTGFEKTGGTMAYFDACHNSFDGSLDFGLRTIAQGSKATDLEFYRLGSGPILGWTPSAGWRLEMGMAFFRESGLAPDGEKIYKSQGRLMSFGWERSKSIGRQLSWSYGGFVSAHRGDLNLTAGLKSNVLPNRLAAQHNQGLSQGAQLALRIQLD